MFTLYDVTKTETGYQFISDFNLTYHLYFSNYYLTGDSGEDLIVTSFGFFYQPRYVRVNDPKVKATIIDFIQNYFDKNPETGIIYLCDQKNGWARHRRIIFGSWHREVNGHIEKHNCGKYHERLGYYSSLLVRADNPQKQCYINAFYRSLAEALPEDIN